MGCVNTLYLESGQMSKGDKRVRRTQRLLSEALIELTAEIGYESISIRDLTERAEIGYATFFRHYKSKDELLHAMLMDFIEELVALLPRFEQMVEPYERGMILFQYVDKHTDIFRVLIGSQGSSAVTRSLKQLAVDKTCELLDAELHDSIPTELAAHVLISGIVGMISWWLDNDKPYEPAKMAEMYYRLLLGPFRSLSMPTETSN